MKILLLGSGGREHAFAWKMTQSNLCTKLFTAPGNAGTAQHGENIDMAVHDFEAIKSFCIHRKIDMLVVGPEEPLVLGIADYFKQEKALQKIQVIGPSAAGAQLEGSKEFSKKFMQRHSIPTAAYAAFDEDSFEEGLQYLEQHSLPIVLKADGLAAGKGVVICETTAYAKDVFTAMIKERQFGDASAKVVVEQFLKGMEASVFVLTDGVSYKIIGHAKDYKRVGEGDKGLNTGGMGCISPVPFAGKDFMDKVEERIIIPTVTGLKADKMDYRGFLFFGLMNVDGEPYLVEYNCRMGDPETQVILPRLKNDLIDLLSAVHWQELRQKRIKIDKRACCTIVAASGGYPGEYKKDFEIEGLEDFEIEEDVMVFQAGTKREGNKVLTNGGRVLAVTALANSLNDAVYTSLEALGEIDFKGMYFRKDIGYEWRQQ